MKRIAHMPRPLFLPCAWLLCIASATAQTEPSKAAPGTSPATIDQAPTTQSDSKTNTPSKTGTGTQDSGPNTNAG